MNGEKVQKILNSKTNNTENRIVENKINDKREEEKKLVFLMIKIFCKSKHKKDKKYKKANKSELCEECMELFDYAAGQICGCRFMETKTFCSVCPSHCYKKNMRKRIREVMIFSGRRMLFYRPILALKHLFITLKYNLKNQKQIKKQIKNKRGN